MIIGIDPGTSCGWAVMRNNGEVIGSGVWNLQPRRHESAGMRFIKFCSSFAELLDHTYAFRESPDDKPLVVYEEVRRHLGVDAAHIYGGLIAHLQTECERRGTDYTTVTVSAAKRAATGRGRASKEEMVEAARKRWPHIEILGDDHADALWIAECGRKNSITWTAQGENDVVI